MSYSIYTKPNIEGFNDIFNGYIDVSNNMVEYNDLLIKTYNKVVKPNTPNTPNETITVDQQEKLYAEIIKKRVNPKPTVVDGRIEDEESQVEQAKYIYLAGTITLVSLIIIMKYL